MFLVIVGLVSLPELGTTAHADVRRDAHEFYERGRAFALDGKHKLAIREYEAAYALLPIPDVLLALARAHNAAGDLEGARDYYQQYLDSVPTNHPEVEDELRSLDAEIAAQSPPSTEVPPPSPSVEPEPPPTEEARPPPTPPSPSNEAAQRSLEEAAAALEAQASRLRGLARSLAPPGDAHASEPDDSTPPQAEGPVENSSGPTDDELVEERTHVRSDSMSDPPPDPYLERVAAASRIESSPLDTAVSTTILTRQDIRMSGATTIGEVLRNVAGVSVMTPTPYASSVSIRGLNRMLSPYVLMLVNGRTTSVDALDTPFWDFQPFMLDDIERIEVIRGPASSIYGPNGFSGVVNVVLREAGGPPGAEITAAAGNGRTYRAHSEISGNAGPAAYRIQGGYVQTDVFARAYDDRRVDIEFPGTDSALAHRETHAGFQLRVPLGQARLSVEGAIGDAPRANFHTGTPYPDLVGPGRRMYAMATLEREHLRIRSFANRDLGGFRNVHTPIGPENVTSTTFDVEASVPGGTSIRWFGDHEFNVGANVRLKHVEWNSLSPNESSQWHFGGFAEDSIRIAERLRLLGSFRIDRHPLITRPVPSARGALLYQPTPTRTVRMTAGSAYRTPSFQDAFADFPVPLPESVPGASTVAIGVTRGSETIRHRSLPEKIASFELGLLDQTNDAFSIDVSAYYNRAHRTSSRSFEPDRGIHLTDLADPSFAAELDAAGLDGFAAAIFRASGKTGRDDIFGSEVTLRMSSGSVDVNLNGAINATHHSVPEDGSNWDRRSSLFAGSAIFQWRHESGFSLAVDGHLSSRTRWPSDDVRRAGLESVSASVPAFYLVNARISYRFADNRLEIGAQAYNLTNNHQRQYPLGQPLAGRYLVTLAVRMGGR